MNYEIVDCIDASTEFCPCHLAEVGECILCSMLRGKNFCDCINWKGVCIYEEFEWNGRKAKVQRQNYECDVLEKVNIENKIFILKLSVPHPLAQNLVHPGSYVFMRDLNTNHFFDAPISIMESNADENWIKVGIEVRGIKTKSLYNVKEGEKVLVRGPYWNGIHGLKNIYASKNETVLIIARGIGQAPTIPVLRKLHANGNKIVLILDIGRFKESFVADYLYKYDCIIKECNTIDRGELSEECKKLITEIKNEENIRHIHCDGPDILTYKVVDYVKNDEINVSCSNNARMCCGEGVCGSCSARFKGQVVKRLCKVQTDPINLIEGRRLI